MAKSKIKSVQQDGTVTLTHGDFYRLKITLDTLEEGEVLAKSADRWKEGQEVEYTISKTEYGNKMKLSLPDSQPFKSSGGGFSPEKERRITFLSCLSSACTFLNGQGAKKENVVQLAEYFTDIALGKGEAKNQAPAPAKSDDDLPF